MARIQGFELASIELQIKMVKKNGVVEPFWWGENVTVHLVFTLEGLVFHKPCLGMDRRYTRNPGQGTTDKVYYW